MPDLFNTINRDLIIAVAARYRVPAIYFFRSFADSGGLISYGPDFAEQYPQAAEYINRILKGEKPGDLPIQMPIKVPLVINLKTASHAEPRNAAKGAVAMAASAVSGSMGASCVYRAGTGWNMIP
jgi:hypothetical protein